MKSKFEQMQVIVEEHGRGHTDAVSRKLEAAFKELYQVAEMVGGDPDDLKIELDEDELEGLQASAMTKFEEAKVESDRARKALCAASAMVSLRRTTRLFCTFDADDALVDHRTAGLLAPMCQTHGSSPDQSLQDRTWWCRKLNQRQAQPTDNTAKRQKGRRKRHGGA